MTELGIIGAAPPVRVAANGSLAFMGDDRRVEVWIGADDRWHRPDAVAGVRQRASADGAGVESRVRVPGGDIVQTVHVVPASGGALARVEVTNDTPVPVAIAAVVLDGGGTVGCYEDLLRVDGAPVVRCSRPISRLAVAADPVALAGTVEGGQAMPPAELAGAVDGSSAAAIVPLPHRATVSFVVAPAASRSAVPAVADVPDGALVARGWETHLDTGTRFSGPDERVHLLLDAALRHCLVASAQASDSLFWNETPDWAPAAVAVALQSWGHGAAAVELLVQSGAAPGPPEAAVGAMVWAWASAIDPAAEPGLLDALRTWTPAAVERLLAALPGRLARRRVPADPWSLLGLAAAPRLLTVLGHTALASDVAGALPRLGAPDDPVVAALGGHLVGSDGSADAVLAVASATVGAEPTGAPLIDLARAAAPTGALGLAAARAHDPAVSALFAIGLRRALVDEPAGIGGPIDLVPGVPARWFGAPIQVHGAPVGGGTIEFAVRWHGPRPAVLWDSAVERPMRLQASRLDPDFADDRASGEALLEPTAGLAVEAGPESARVRRGQQLDPGVDGPSSFQ